MKNAVALFAKGWRTLSAVLAFLVTGLLSVAGALDLTPVVSLFVNDPALLGAAMVAIGALFGFLRYITSTPLFSATPAPQLDADTSQVDEAPVLKRDIDEGA